MSKLLRRTAAGLLVVCAAMQIGGTESVRASSSGIVISQVYGGGGNSGATYKNDFIELFNAGSVAVDITGWSVQYASSAGTSWTNRTILSGVIQPGHYYLIQEAAGAGGTTTLPSADVTGSISMAAGGGKVVLQTTSTPPASGTVCPSGPTIVDVVGYGTGTTCFEGTGPTPAPSNTTAALRKNGGATDTDNNAADFSTGAPTPRNSACTLAEGCPVTTVLSITANPISALQGDPIVLTVSIVPGANPPSTGISVKGDLTAIGGSAAQAFFDDGTSGDIKSGDLVFSFAASPVADPATYSVLLTAVDAQGRAATPATLKLTVAPLTAIHDIQGPGTISPLIGQTVTTRGIVTGVKYNGFFVQAAESEADSDPKTSEGVFVFTSSTPPGPAVVGNRVQVSGKVSEFKNTSTDPDGLSATELTAPTVTLLSTGNDLPAAVTLVSSDLNPGGSIYALEKYEGMRVHVDSVLTISPTDGTVDEPNATSISSGVFFGVLPGTGRPFREPGIETPLPVPPDAPSNAHIPVFDANPERVGVDTFSVFIDPATAAVYPPPPGTTLEVTTGVTVTNITGPLDYASRSYTIDAEGWNMPTASWNIAVQPVRPRTGDEFTIASMNLARFFDTVDDPGLLDVALTANAFTLRLGKASTAIRNVLQGPDIVGVEEMENIATLQALADGIFTDSNGVLDYVPYLLEGNDIGGIDVGVLARRDKVKVSSVEQIGKDTLFTEPDGSRSKLNDRPSLIVRAAIVNTPYDDYPATIVVNHLKAMSGLDGATGARNRAKRLAQAVELAAKLQELQAAGDHIVSVGDYNAFEVNDGYTDLLGLLKGTEIAADQVTLWAPSPVTPPLFDALDLAPADQRYSYVFDGNAQEIDHIIYSANVQANGIGYGRMNADFPESLRGSGDTPARLSDHDPVVGYFSLPDIDKTAPTLTLPESIRVEGNAFGGAFVSYQASAWDAVDGAIAPACSKASGALFPLGTTTVTCSAVDAHGNRVDGSFTVGVADTTVPVIAALTPSAPTLWPANHMMVPLVIGVSVSDVVDPAPACRITGVTGDDAANVNDSQITGPLAVSLRAERLGKGDGRTYTITIECTDASGNNAAPGTASVLVPHDMRK